MGFNFHCSICEELYYLNTMDEIVNYCKRCRKKANKDNKNNNVKNLGGVEVDFLDDCRTNKGFDV